MERLRELLAGTRPGKLVDDGRLSRALAACWAQFAGDSGGMRPEKLFRRMEDIEWNPPVLRFRIERHGGVCVGSSRAEIQTWELDIEQGMRSWQQSGYRQTIPNQPRLHVKPLAEEIAAIIRGGGEDRRLKWREDGSVRVLIREVLPELDSPKQTREGRRKRFWTALDESLAPDWRRFGSTCHPATVHPNLT